jgi:hypothetical protein
MPYMVIITAPDGTETTSIQAKAPDYPQIRAAVNGMIEHVPHFSRYEHAGVSYKRGQAYVNEEGLIRQLPINGEATRQWLMNLGKGPFRYQPRLFGTMIFWAKIKSPPPLPNPIPV